MTSANRMFNELPLSIRILWTLWPSITVEIIKVSSYGCLTPCPSAGMKVMGSCQELYWPIITRTWSPSLLLLLLVMPTLVDEPLNMIRTSESIGLCCLASPPSPFWGGSFFRNCMMYPCVRSLSTCFLRA
jgi:hypothetical protein